MSNNNRVTRASLQQMLDNPNPAYVERVVGRALVALFQYQTADEKHTNATRDHNNVGFSACDAKSGSLTAKTFMRNGRLALWQVQKWTRKDAKGQSRLTKYWQQLDRIAQLKANKESSDEVDPRITKFKDNQYVAEASTLGWSTGVWPSTTNIKVGNGQPLHLVRTDSDHTHYYRQEGSGVMLTVFND